jgi:hypothetical protein
LERVSGLGTDFDYTDTAIDAEIEGEAERTEAEALASNLENDVEGEGKIETIESPTKISDFAKATATTMGITAEESVNSKGNVVLSNPSGKLTASRSLKAWSSKNDNGYVRMQKEKIAVTPSGKLVQTEMVAHGVVHADTYAR